jgi:hypothetical protein
MKPTGIYKPTYIIFGTKTQLYNGIYSEVLLNGFGYVPFRKDHDDQCGGALLAVRSDVLCYHITLSHNTEAVPAFIQLENNIPIAVTMAAGITTCHM